MYATRLVCPNNVSFLDEKQKQVVRDTIKWTRFLSKELDTALTISVGLSNKMTISAGYCKKVDKHRYHIMLSNYFIETAPEYESTVAHEVAHAYQFALYSHSAPHGREFFNILRLTGFPLVACHNYRIAHRESTTIYQCPRCNSKILLGFNLQLKIFNGSIRRCRACYKRIELEKIQLVQSNQPIQPILPNV